MDFPHSILLALALLLAFKFFYYFKKTRADEITAPEPPGAWPIIGHLHLLSGQEPVARILGSMADKYGPILTLRLGAHRALVVSNTEVIKECFTTNDRIFATRPSIATGKHIFYESAAFAVSPYGPYWRNIRKMVNLELLTTRRLDSLSHFRATEVHHFIQHLYSISTTPNRVLALSSWFEHLTFNIIVEMLVGKRFPYSCDSNNISSDNRQFKEAVKKAVYLNGVFVMSDVIPCLEWFDVGGYLKGMKECAKELDEVLAIWVQERIESCRKDSDHYGSDCPDFLDVMLSAIPENEVVHGYDRETLIKATMLILIFTGSESTAETLIWATSLLLNNQHALKTAQLELETNIGRDRWVQESDLPNLSYLNAIVKETLRLYPPGPLSGPREATENCQVGHSYVPKGTRLIVNLWKLHRDPNVWSEPDEFKPERFMEEHKDVNFKGQCFEYIPFSSGRRMCPGMTFGLHVVHLTLARVIQGFDLSTPDGERVDMGEGLGLALPKLKPLEVILTPRLPTELYENL